MKNEKEETKKYKYGKCNIKLKNYLTKKLPHKKITSQKNYLTKKYEIKNLLTF